MKENHDFYTTEKRKNNNGIFNNLSLNTIQKREKANYNLDNLFEVPMYMKFIPDLKRGIINLIISHFYLYKLKRSISKIFNIKKLNDDPCCEISINKKNNDDCYLYLKIYTNNVFLIIKIPTIDSDLSADLEESEKIYNIYYKKFFKSFLREEFFENESPIYVFFYRDSSDIKIMKIIEDEIDENLYVISDSCPLYNINSLKFPILPNDYEIVLNFYIEGNEVINSFITLFKIISTLETKENNFFKLIFSSKDDIIIEYLKINLKIKNKFKIKLISFTQTNIKIGSYFYYPTIDFNNYLQSFINKKSILNFAMTKEGNIKLSSLLENGMEILQLFRAINENAIKDVLNI